MRLLMFSWEYPPKSVGGLAQHVYDLTMALSEQGVDIHLITCGSPGAKEKERVKGVNVYRVSPYQVSSSDFVTWVTQFNVAMLERAVEVLDEIGSVDILHAHDWLVAYAARAVKHGKRKPLIATIHATEWGRNNGLHNNMQRHISDVEWWLTYEAWKVICCSKYMESELKHVFQLPVDKLEVIPNGVNLANFTTKNRKISRTNYAAPGEKIVFYVGRLVREKGVQVLIDAAPEILARCPKTKFIIAGKGPFEDVLRRQAENLGISERVYFTGYVEDDVRNTLYSWADVAVFPSLYEPFGIVALEGMAARTPVVVSDTGGISEIVEHGVDGLKANTGDARSIAKQVIEILSDDVLARSLKENAYRKVKKEYTWPEIAGRTIDIYREVINAHRKSPWAQVKFNPGKRLWKVNWLLGRYS